MITTVKAVNQRCIMLITIICKTFEEKQFIFDLSNAHVALFTKETFILHSD